MNCRMPATIRETMPRTIVTIQPIGSAPGWKNRPSAPTIAPTMMSHIHVMVRTVPFHAGTKPRQDATRGGRRTHPVREQSLIDEMREAMKDARERAEERREHSHESALLAPEPARPEPE